MEVLGQRVETWFALEIAFYNICRLQHDTGFPHSLLHMN